MNKTNDPILRDAEKVAAEGLSPMDPPDAMSPPASVDPVPREQLAPFLRELVDEHAAFVERLSSFEETLASIREQGITRENGGRLSEFFEHFDVEFTAHHRKEERHLFPVLEEKLRESGEHGAGPEQLTGVGVMEDDHDQSLQLAAVVFNFFGLASRLPDANSRAIVMDAALKQGEELVEQLRLHIFREDNVIFPLAHQLIDVSVLEAMGN